MFTDTHCHVLSLEYDNIEDILNNLTDNNIKRIIINGYNLESNQEVIKLVNKYPNVYGALGIHPDNIYENQNETISYIKENINNPKIIAIGEIGLDYYHNKENKEDQMTLFKKMLNIAHEVNKPVIIHNRESTDDMLRILKSSSNRGIIHSFSGSYETAKEYIKLGYHLGINGIITFKNSKLSEVIKKVSIDNVLLETDCPYLTPEPLRKYRNEPKNVILIAQRVSEIKDIELDKLAEILEINFHNIFDI